MDPHYQHLFCDHVIKSDFKTLSKSKTATYKCVKDKENGAESSLIN